MFGWGLGLGRGGLGLSRVLLLTSPWIWQPASCEFQWIVHSGWECCDISRNCDQSAQLSGGRTHTLQTCRSACTARSNCVGVEYGNYNPGSVLEELLENRCTAPQSCDCWLVLGVCTLRWRHGGFDVHLLVDPTTTVNPTTTATTPAPSFLTPTTTSVSADTTTTMVTTTTAAAPAATTATIATTATTVTTVAAVTTPPARNVNVDVPSKSPSTSLTTLTTETTTEAQTGSSTSTTTVPPGSWLQQQVLLVALLGTGAFAFVLCTGLVGCCGCYFLEWGPFNKARHRGPKVAPGVTFKRPAVRPDPVPGRRALLLCISQYERLVALPGVKKDEARANDLFEDFGFTVTKLEKSADDMVGIQSLRDQVCKFLELVGKDFEEVDNPVVFVVLNAHGVYKPPEGGGYPQILASDVPCEEKPLDMPGFASPTHEFLNLQRLESEKQIYNVVSELVDPLAKLKTTRREAYISLAILNDACRAGDYPLSRKAVPIVPIGRGPHPLQPPSMRLDTYMFFSCDPGMLAKETHDGGYMMQELEKVMRGAHATGQRMALEEVLQQVARNIAARVFGDQRPWVCNRPGHGPPLYLW